MKRRSPHGERGLKSFLPGMTIFSAASLPPRGAWIEILPIGAANMTRSRRSPHGERGLKS